MRVCISYASDPRNCFSSEFFLRLLEFLGLFPPKKYRETAFPKKSPTKESKNHFQHLQLKGISTIQLHPITMPPKRLCDLFGSASTACLSIPSLPRQIRSRGEFCWRGSISNVDSNEFNESQKKKKKVPGMGRKEKTPTALKQMRFISFRCKGTQNKTCLFGGYKGHIRIQKKNRIASSIQNPLDFSSLFGMYVLCVFGRQPFSSEHFLNKSSI